MQGGGMETKPTQGCTGLSRVAEAANRSFLPLPEAQTGRPEEGTPGRAVSSPYPQMEGSLFRGGQALVHMSPVESRTLTV